jgi:hypothetical protein
MALTTDRGIKENVGMAVQILQTISKPVFEGCVYILPKAIHYTSVGYTHFMKLPQNCLHFIYGSVFCFYGGNFPTLFAAIQAAEYSGRETLVKALGDLSNEAITIINESKKDDDTNKDTISKETSSEYFTRKTKLVLRKMNPEKVDKAIGSMYSVWLSVAAVLSVEFAKTISMALAIADFLKKPLDRFVTPTIQIAVPSEYDKWVPVVMSWVAKSIAMSIAWYIQVRKILCFF